MTSRRLVASVFSLISILLASTKVYSVSIYEDTIVGSLTEMEEYSGERVTVHGNAVLTLIGYASTGSPNAYLYDNSTINLKGNARLIGYTKAYNTSTVNIHGGSFYDRITVMDESSVHVFGGRVAQLFADGSGTINIFGGDVDDSINLRNQANLNIWGTDLALSLSHTNGAGAFYTISGTLLDGSPLNQLLSTSTGFEGSIELHPENIMLSGIISSNSTLTLSWGFDYNRYIVEGISDLAGGFSETTSTCIASSAGEGAPASSICIPLESEQKNMFFQVNFGKRAILFPDHTFNGVIRSNIVSKTMPVGEIYDIELTGIHQITAPSLGIADLTGIEAIPRLAVLNVESNLITDLLPIMNLVTNGGFSGPETALYLSGNPLSEHAQSTQIPALINDFEITVYWP